MKTKVAVALAAALGFTTIVASHAEAARRPDLIVPSISVPSSASPNATIVVSSTVKNQGTANAASFRVGYYLSANPSSTTGAAVLGTQNVFGLTRGASVALITSFTVPGSTTGGSHYVVAVADSTKVVRESNESNNTRASAAMAVGDVTPPTIGAVSSSGMTTGSATITWTTNESSTSQVEYGSTTAYGSMSALNTSGVTSHSVGVSGLAASTLYHFRVRSTDASGNTAVSSDYTFSTTAATTSTGKTYYVATIGNDSNPGSQSLPFRTISRGVTVLKPGDTLFIRGGLYAEAIHDIPSGTSWGAPVTVAAYPGEAVTVKPGATGWPLVYLYNRSYIVMDRLIFDGSTTSSDMEGIFLDTNTHHIRIQNGEVKNSPGSGLFVDNTSHHNEFLNMTIHDNGVSDFDHGFYIEGANNLVEDSDIYRNSGWGVHIYSGGIAGVANSNVIRNNRIYDNARVGGRGAGIILSSGNWNLVYNNIVWGNTGGIQIGYGTPTGTEVYNNTLYGNRNYGIKLHGDGTNSIVKNNILYQNETSVYGTQFSNSGTGTQSSNNLTGTDPRFVDIAARDFHLQAGSPAIDQGVLVDDVTTDFDGTARPHGAAMDVGAMEFAN